MLLVIFFPKKIIKYRGKNCNYSAEILKRFYFEDKLKSYKTLNLYSGWIRAVNNYQKIIIYKKLKIAIPILILNCSASIKSYEQEKGDSIININHIEKYSKNIGSNIKLVKIKNAIHDVLCSENEPRLNAIKELFNLMRN